MIGRWCCFLQIHTLQIQTGPWLFGGRFWARESSLCSGAALARLLSSDQNLPRTFQVSQDLTQWSQRLTSSFNSSECLFFLFFPLTFVGKH